MPQPLEIIEPIVKYEFIRMPDSTGFGDYTETGQVIPVSFLRRKGQLSSIRCISTTRRRSRAAAKSGASRRSWRSPKLTNENEVLIGTLHYGPVLCAVATMGYKHKILDPDPILRALDEPNFLIKIIPHVDGSLRICELVRYHMQDVELKGAWSGPGGAAIVRACDGRRRQAAGSRSAVRDRISSPI